MKFFKKAVIPALAGMTTVLLVSSDLWAMAARPSDPNAPPPPAWVQFFPFVVMIGVFYLLLFRPQAKQRKEKQQMMDALKKGDKVVTQGGFIATVVNIYPATLEVKLNDETKVKILRSAVTEIWNEQAEK